MSYEIPDGSPWKEAAVRVGAELRRALESRRVGWRQLNVAIGKDVHSMVDRYKHGRNLPRLGQAALLAEALAWPKLLELVREARTFVCPIDGRTFVCDTGHRGKYCSTRCRSVDANRRARLVALERQEAKAYRSEDPERALVARLKQELTRVRHGTQSLSRKEIRAALVQFERTAPQAPLRRARNQLNEHLAAVEAFCAACEPEGICRTGDCPLRSVSPLPFIPMADVALAQRQPTRQEIWAGSDQRRANHSATMRRRWQDPGRREAQGARTRSWWASLSPAERVTHAEKVSEARRGKPSLRDCGCPNRKHLEQCPIRAVAL
jgi:hypothetical protein